jgi:hypothetical protein
MISGKKIPDDVMALYRKYKGPEFKAWKIDNMCIYW